MPEENDNQDNLGAGNPSRGNSGGRIFAAAEDAEPKINLDEEIEKNIRIRTMPRKFKISTAGGDKKTKVIGAVIMVVGLLVLVAAVYLAYIFLINPQAKTPVPAAKVPAVKTETLPAKEIPAKEIPPAVENIPVAPIIQATSTGAEEIPPAVSGTSTPGIATSSVPAVAASTTPVVGAPTGAKIITSLSIAEKALFGADPAKDDSDADGYGDLAEVLVLYNPAGAGKIIDNTHIGAYENTANKYSVYYPKNWRTQNLENGDSLIFTAADNSLIQIISQPNAGKQSIKDWYSEQFPDAAVSDADIYSHDGWQGIFQQDKEIFYLADIAGNRLYTISYVPAADNDVSFYNIFLMMINSFIVK